MSDRTPSDRTPVDQSEATDEIEQEQTHLPPGQRDNALARDNYRCRACNRQDEQRGGTVTLEVHHREDDPAHCEYHDLQNLTVLCPSCHRWLHRQPDSGDLPEAIQDRLNGADLEPTWVGILQYLARAGPATTSTITEHVDLQTVNGVRNALYGLMAADQEQSGVTGRLVAKDRFTDEYGLPWQIPDAHDARGVIPVSAKERRGRILDELVRRMDAHLPEDLSEREEILSRIVERDAQHVDVLRRRGEAFQFPFAEWAGPGERSASTRRQSVIEAVATVARVADDVPAELLVGVVTEPLEAAGEEELASALREWIETDNSRQMELDGETVAEPTPSEEEVSEPREPLEGEEASPLRANGATVEHPPEE